MEQTKTNRYRELENRTTEFAKDTIKLCQGLPKGAITNPLISQVIRSSGSIGANYREANEAISKKDFMHRLRIARKEAKETDHWLELIATAHANIVDQVVTLRHEVSELRNILSAIIFKVEYGKDNKV